MYSKMITRPEKWILLGIPVLFAIGSGIHSLYTILNENIFVGLFAPVNESIWEHSKMVILPIILWWLLYYRIRGREYDIDKNQWYAGALVSLIVALLSMPGIYYFYTSAFGKELLWADILILLASLFLGQILGFHVYRRSRGLPPVLVIIICIIIILIFVWFTFSPPHLPLFQDGVTGSYGIPNS